MEAERKHALTQAERRRREDRRALGASLSISVVLHVLVLQMAYDPGLVDSTGTEGSGTIRPLDAIRVLELDPREPSPGASGDDDVPLPGDGASLQATVAPGTVEPEAVEEPVDVELDRGMPVGRTTGPDGAPVPASRADGNAGKGSSAASGLRPAPTEARLWRPVTTALEIEAPVEGRLHSRLDSLVLESDGVRVPAAGDMSVWTARDRRGDRWGVSPGRLHMGAVTIPVCGGDFDASNCGFGVQPAFRDEYRRRVRAFLEIRMQGNHAFLQERARATRARLDRARDSLEGSAPRR